MTVNFVVSAEEAGLRLDQLLAGRVAGLSRRRARVLIDLGGVFVDRRRVKIASRPMRAREKVVAHLGGALQRSENRVGEEARDAEEQRLPIFRIVHEDEDLVVVDKPAGLLTAPTPESDRSNLLSLLQRREKGVENVQVVHRLDLPTSGLLAFSKSDLALRALTERFRQHDLERAYLAVVAGIFPSRIALIDQPIERRPARTRVQLLERLGTRATLLRLELETGRTHQIRLHCRALGHPVLGDSTHGQPSTIDPPRLALHATRLAFPHPRTSEPLAWDSPWPPDLTPWLEKLRARASEPGSRSGG